jgi:hypothetical protein
MTNPTDEPAAADLSADIADDEPAGAVCLTCTTVNHPLSTFCVKCGAPISPLSVYGPLETVMTQGHGLRNAVDHPSRLALIGVWLIFFPTVFVFIFILGGIISASTGIGPIGSTATYTQGNDLSDLHVNHFVTRDRTWFQGTMDALKLVVSILMLVGIFVLYLMILIKITRNYCRAHSDESPHPPDGD